MTRLLLAALAALSLAGCAAGYGYEYAYDPYAGVRGHHVGPFEPRAAVGSPACPRLEFRGPYYDGYRGPYYAGPYCAPAGTATDAAARAPGG